MKVNVSKIVSLHVKLEFKCIQTSRKEKFHKQPAIVFLKNSYFARRVFCMFESIHTIGIGLKGKFSRPLRKIHILMNNLLKDFFYCSSFTPNFLSRYFSELLFLAGDIKLNKIYQLKLTPGDRLWELEIAL